MSYRVGLTGNIGTGKSTVAGMLQALGAAVIDADRVAHELMVPHTPEWDRIVERFGRDILNADETIDRKRLGALVFADPAAFRALERILHPGVRPLIRQRFAATEHYPVVVVEAIKLIEASLYLECDALWVVVADRATQIARLIATRGMPPEDAATRVDAQAPQADKVALADVVIENNGDLAATQRQVLAAWEQIQAGTAAQRRGEPR